MNQWDNKLVFLASSLSFLKIRNKERKHLKKNFVSKLSIYLPFVSSTK